MLFNSYIFIFVFLPITLLLFFSIARAGRTELAICSLVVTSLFFYGWWNPNYLILIIFSIAFNFLLGRRIADQKNTKIKKSFLVLGIIVNLGLLGYFKYTNFLVDSLNTLIQTNFYIKNIILPLAISFFTFQQIAYLCDAFKGETREYSFNHYCLFVCFFPQLIAGPIVHHKEMLSQFNKKATFTPIAANFSVGLSIFALGLFKKVVLADGVAVYSTPVFALADSGASINPVDAWAGATAYTLQIYFDFSGYSDMAIGLARLFGINLPLNFHSPYKATSIIEFWRRWHMTLSRFLREYLYIPLGGNRNGEAHRYKNLMLTMLLGGIWHGAGWNFAIWGLLHGVYLAINHGWRAMPFIARIPKTRFFTALYTLITLLAVIIAWVFFRAGTLEGAVNLLNSMFFLSTEGMVVEVITKKSALRWFIILFCICWFSPNSQQIFAKYNTPLGYSSDDSEKQTKLLWQPSKKWAVCISFLFFLAIISLTSFSEFLYFQF